MVASTSTGRRAIFCLLAIAFTALLALVGLGSTPTQAQEPSGSTTLSIAEAVDRDCFRENFDGAAGTDATTVPGPPLGDDARAGAIEARLTGPAGSDWDLAVFDQSGRVIAASTQSGAHEIAGGYLTDPGELTVQACRLSGEGDAAELRVDTVAYDTTEVEKASLVHVETPTRRDKELLQGLGLDLTEHGGEDYVAVVLYGAEDEAALEKAGLDYEVEVANLARQSVRRAELDAAYAARTRRSALPSGRDTYRRLFHYTNEMKKLAEDHPDLVRPFTLPHKTWEGRTLEGIEITTDPNTVRDGKPIFLQMGLHHAREWPSGEHAMEWAYELINGYESGDPRVVPLVEKTRTIIVPVDNPDGFNASREAGEAAGYGNGNDGDFLVNVATSPPNEYRRKNCRYPDDSEGGNCTAEPAFGVASFGVDPNRNYGAFWGGPGSSGDPSNETYRGPGPFSEPETQNIRELISARQVVTLITNHTFSNLVLRPPGLSTEPDPVDEPLYKAFGGAMAAENGYANQKGYELYDTTGTTEDWSYNSTGGLGFTFEIGCNGEPEENPTENAADCGGSFHPTFPNVVAEWEGTSKFAQAVGGQGNREAYYIAQESTADPTRHSVLEGSAPHGAILKLEKTFQTPTSVEDPASFEDHLETALKVLESGRFDWHINPSTRPLVAQDRGRPAAGPPPAANPDSFSGDVSGAAPCADYDTEDPACFNDHPFEIPDGGDADSATVHIEWPAPTSDWDLKVFRDTNGDGSSLGEPEIAASGQGATNFESATFTKPERADGQLERGQYVARVINWAAVEPYDGTVTVEGPEEFIPAKIETWRLTCTYAGETRVTQDILIARGERQTLDLNACGTKGGSGKAASCQGKSAKRLEGSSKDDTFAGSPGPDKMLGFGGNDSLNGLGKGDCVLGQSGRDKVKGGPGGDIVQGNKGPDNVKGNGGDDDVRGQAGNDKVKGNGGKDIVRGGTGNDKLRGDEGSDKLKGSGGKDKLRGGAARDKMHAGGGADKVNAVDAKRDKVNCGTGQDRATVDDKDKVRNCEKVTVVD